MWLTDINSLWNSNKNLYGRTEDMLQFVEDEERILPIGKPSRHSALSIEEFKKKYKLEIKEKC